MELPVKATHNIQRLDRLYIKFRQVIGMVVMPFEAVCDMAIFITRCRLSPFVVQARKDSYDLIFFSHTIEKGLSLPHPRPLFGRNNICRVLHLLRRCHPQQVNPVAIHMALGSLYAYISYHRRLSINAPFLIELADELATLVERYPEFRDGGTKDVAGIASLIENRQLSYSEFLESRYSCRNFQEGGIPQERLHEIIRIAQQAPSQCNRQATRIHIYQEKQEIETLLALQGGARGFATRVPALIVVTSDLSAWSSRAERNQCYVDSGLFAMALMYSCHSQGVGSCGLNFSKTNFQEWGFRRAAQIPPGERIVMLMALGLQDEKSTLAARSARAPIEEILRVH